MSLHAFSHSWEWFCWWRSGDLIFIPWQFRIHKCFLQTHGWGNYIAMLDQVGLIVGVILCLILETKVHALLGAAYFTRGDSGVDSLSSSSRCSCRLRFVSEFQTPNPNLPSGYECLLQNTVSWYMWVREIGCVFKEIPSCKSVEYSGSCWKLDLCSCIHQFPLHLGILNLSNWHWIYIISSVCYEKSELLF